MVLPSRAEISPFFHSSCAICLEAEPWIFYNMDPFRWGKPKPLSFCPRSCIGNRSFFFVQQIVYVFTDLNLFVMLKICGHIISYVHVICVLAWVNLLISNLLTCIWLSVFPHVVSCFSHRASVDGKQLFSFLFRWLDISQSVLQIWFHIASPFLDSFICQLVDSDLLHEHHFAFVSFPAISRVVCWCCQR